MPPAPPHKRSFRIKRLEFPSAMGRRSGLTAAGHGPSAAGRRHIGRSVATIATYGRYLKPENPGAGLGGPLRAPKGGGGF